MSVAYAELDQALAELGSLKSKQEVLNKSYLIITSRYRGRRFHTFWTAVRFFNMSPAKLWLHKGFMDCLHQNKLLAALLLGSGQFKKSDIRRKWTLYWGVSPHQYLIIKLGAGKFISVDTWSAAHGIKLGDYGHWFHTRARS